MLKVCREWMLLLLLGRSKVKAVGMGKVKDTVLQAGQDIIKKHNYNIRIIVIILKDILYKVAIEAVHGSTEVAVGKIEFDSRKIEKNVIFVAIRGSVSDGMNIFKSNRIRSCNYCLIRS
jgi:hypothetical protein